MVCGGAIPIVSGSPTAAAMVAAVGQTSQDRFKSNGEISGTPKRSVISESLCSEGVKSGAAHTSIF
jgi:hypothetical protein